MKNLKFRSKLLDLLNTETTVSKLKYIPMIRSRHPSHNGLRGMLQKLPFRSVIRFGSTTQLNDTATLNGSRVELNSINAIKNSSSKLLMKRCFEAEKVKTAPWTQIQSRDNRDLFDFINQVGFPIVAKSHNGSRGRGNTILKTQEEVDEFLNSRPNNLNGYIFEKYCNFNKEYRLHVTEDGCFYSCRKMLKQEFKDHPNNWQRHDDNCVWILEENENFDKPDNWNDIVEHCVKAIKSCGLDFGACDLRVQNNTDSDGNRRSYPDFIVVEVNSAPSMGEITLIKYKELLPNLLIKKYNEKK
jgi:glutathione synthase/RimK-type ligase-like ATP-grasp enzyme